MKPETDSTSVDWTSVTRPSFRRAFFESHQSVTEEEATARRLALGVEIESDPTGNGRTPAPLRSFSELALLPRWMSDALAENKWEAPMPIQAQSLPILLAGRNLIGIAQTGSGKTVAFLIPMVVHANSQRPLSRSDQGPIGLVLAPTRELAVQISDEAEKLLKYSSWNREHPGGMRSVSFYGGGKKGDQLRNFSFTGSHILVATPGRLLDFWGEKRVSLHRVTFLVLDEADRMLELGFRSDMDRIGAGVRPERQTAFFSATWSNEVQSLACALCVDAPVTIRVGDARTANTGGGDVLMAREGITQEVVVVDFPDDPKPWVKQEEEKNILLEAHIKRALQEENAKMLIFVNQKNFADELCDKLWKEGVNVDALHGGRPQQTRLWVLDRFRKGETRLLIATDVMGRGLDVPDVTHVVVYSMGGIEDYIHRIGRTGRGKDGKGHALVFFEFMPKQPGWARELIAVLEKSNQPVPVELRQIADDVDSGKRGSSGGGSGWGSSRWSTWGQNWKNGEWKENDWKASSAGQSLAQAGISLQHFDAAKFVPWNGTAETSGDVMTLKVAAQS